MATRYPENFKKQVVEDYILGTKTLSEISSEYNVSKTALRTWIKKYREECKNTTNAGNSNTLDTTSEIRRLHKELAEKEKEIAFLKKAAAFFAKEID